MDIFRLQFGEKLAKALAEAGLRQNSLAEKLGVKDSTVSRWVNGHDFPESTRLDEICKIVKKPITFFTNPEVVIKTDPLPEWAEKLNQEIRELKKTVEDSDPRIREARAILAALDDKELEIILAAIRASFKGIQRARDTKAGIKKRAHKG